MVHGGDAVVVVNSVEKNPVRGGSKWVRLDEETYEKLVELQLELQWKQKRRLSMDDVVRTLIDIYVNRNGG